jgi:hypothetical protein
MTASLSKSHSQHILCRVSLVIVETSDPALVVLVLILELAASTQGRALSNKVVLEL